MKTIPNGYVQRKDGNWQRTISFGKKKGALETLIRNSRGVLMTVVAGALPLDQGYSARQDSQQKVSIRCQ